MSTPTTADVAVIGGGVVGTAVARRVARTRLSVVVLEAGADIGAGTSKANTAILHTGFDTKPGTVESGLVRRGFGLLDRYAAEAGIPVEHLGALLVAWTDEQLAELPILAARAAAVGYDRCEVVEAAECYQREPNLGPGALGGLTVPDESIICPWTTPLAYATEALANGASLDRARPVLDARRLDDGWELATPAGPVRCAWVVNAAGLYADDVERLLGFDWLEVRPRRGELVVFDKLARPLVREILLPVPTGLTKGVLVSPTVFGNVVLGPTAEDLDDKADTSSSTAGLAALMEAGRRILPALVDEEVTAVYAGLRAATDDTDYRLAFRADERSVCLGGIRSTGLTASLAIAEWVADHLAGAGVDVRDRADAVGVRMPDLGEAAVRPYRDAARIATDPEYGRIVCHCERVSAGELRDACASPIPPTDLDGLRRRTRVLMGRCQGFACTGEVTARFPRSFSALPTPSGYRERSDNRGQDDARHAGGEWAGIDRVDVLVVGGGPAGIAAAVSLRRAGQRVTVVEREAAVGGIARHSHHTGYGLVEFRRLMRGPAYARAWARAAASAGVDVRTETTATGWHGDDATGRILELTSPAGIQRVEARAVILATGTRERPRAARLVPGSRPTGVLTTGALQQLVTLHHLDVGRHAVVVGAEHVSFSAILTLARARCSTVAIVTPESRHQTHPLLALATARRHRVPVLTGATVSRIVGSPRVEAVEITDAGGDTYRIECDTVVFTGDWTPDHELARRGGVVIDPLTRAPRVDTGLRTSTPGVFAAGNLLHGAESAAVCARSGAWVATAVRSWLAEPQWWPAERAVPIECAPPLRWISPSAVVPGDRAVPHGHFLARTACFAPRPTVVVRQGQRDLWRGRIRSTVPNRPVHLPAEWLSDVEPGEAVRIEFAP